MTTLYHATTVENADAIIADGKLVGPVYFTPRREMADEYVFNNADYGVVFEIEIDDALLNIDRESYDGDDLDDALDSGVSVYTSGDVSIRDAQIHHVE